MSDMFEITIRHPDGSTETIAKSSSEFFADLLNRVGSLEEKVASLQTPPKLEQPPSSEWFDSALAKPIQDWLTSSGIGAEGFGVLIRTNGASLMKLPEYP